MALFKPFKGDSSLLSNQPIHEGYCWLTTDDGKLYVDISNDTRIPLNAETASKVKITLNGEEKELTINQVLQETGNIYIADTEVTIPAMIDAELEKGRLVFLQDNNIFYPLVAKTENGTYVFDSLAGNNRKWFNLSADGVWTEGTTPLATLNNPIFTGQPEAPTPTDTSNKNQIANINFVEQQMKQVQQSLPAGLLKGSGSVDTSGNLNDPTIYQAIEYKDYLSVRGTYPQSLSLSAAGESSQQFTYEILSDSFINLKNSLSDLIDKLPQGTLRTFIFYLRHENVTNFSDTPFYRDPKIDGGQGFVVEIFKSLSSNITNLTFRVYYGGGCRWIYAARDNSGQWKNFDQSSGLSSFHYFDENTQVLKPKKVVNNKEVDINILGWDHINQKLVDNESKVVLSSNIANADISSNSKVYSTNYINSKLNTINNTITNVLFKTDLLPQRGTGTAIVDKTYNAFYINTLIQDGNIQKNDQFAPVRTYSANHINNLLNRHSCVNEDVENSELNSTYMVRGEAIFPIGSYEGTTPKKGQVAWFYV